MTPSRAQWISSMRPTADILRLYGKGKMSKSEQYLRSPKKNFTTENFFGVSDAEFCADFSDTTHWAETGSKKKRTQKNCPKWPKMG